MGIISTTTLAKNPSLIIQKLHISTRHVQIQQQHEWQVEASHGCKLDLDLLRGPEEILHSSDDPLERRSAMVWPDLLPGCLHWHLKMRESNPTINYLMKEEEAAV